MWEGIKLVNFKRNFFLVRKSIHVAGCYFASSFAWPRNLIPSSKKLFLQFNMRKKTVKDDRAQYGGYKNCVTTLQHHNFPQLFSISPKTNNWTLDIFRPLFEPYHTCKSDRKHLGKNSLTLRVWVHVRRSISFFHSFNCSNARGATVLAPFWLNSESHVINMLFPTFVSSFNCYLFVVRV